MTKPQCGLWHVTFLPVKRCTDELCSLHSFHERWAAEDEQHRHSSHRHYLMTMLQPSISSDQKSTKAGVAASRSWQPNELPRRFLLPFDWSVFSEFPVRFAFLHDAAVTHEQFNISSLVRRGMGAWRLPDFFYFFSIL